VLRPREDGCWLRMAARPTRATGVLLLRHSFGGPRRVAVAVFGPSGLDMLICRE
jgi:hypothetical protein